MKRKQDPTKLKTRPDLADDQWLAWLACLPENAGIDIAELYRKMLDWCGRKRVTPTRRRLLVWLDSEREAVPMKPVAPKPVEQPSPAGEEIRCRTCFDTGEKTFFPNPNSIKGSYTAPCPGCQPQGDK